MVITTMFLRRTAYLLSVSGMSMIMLALFAAAPAGAIARGYTTQDQGLQTGMVAALSTAGSSTVERATQKTSERVVGVVTTYENSSVTVSSDASGVLVESEGEVQVYVSDIGGVVDQGSLLVLSPLKGILMKGSLGTSLTVVGIASESVTAGTETTTYPFSDSGTNKETKIAKIKINLNRQGAANNGANVKDSPLAKLGKALVGKDVGEIRVLLALILFIVVLIAEGGIIYGAVSSSIVALGRNPLARKIIRREMTQVAFVAFGVLLVGLGAVYGVLWI